MSNITQTMVSNLLTMSICSGHDKRQKVGDPYTIPDEETRRLRAQLILEEALETIYALGMGVVSDFNGLSIMPSDDDPDLEKIIDGCCDLNYVLTGTLVSCGVPDSPHYDEVNKCNLAKFPNAVATFNESGKYQKPNGWVGPDHAKVQEAVVNAKLKSASLQDLAKHHMRVLQGKERREKERDTPEDKVRDHNRSDQDDMSGPVGHKS